MSKLIVILIMLGVLSSSITVEVDLEETLSNLKTVEMVGDAVFEKLTYFIGRYSE